MKDRLTDPDIWEQTPSNRTDWRHQGWKETSKYEDDRLARKKEQNIEKL